MATSASFSIFPTTEMSSDSKETSAKFPDGDEETLSPEELQKYDYDVPKTLWVAACRFVREPGVLLIMGAMAVVGVLRLDHAWRPSDALIMPMVAVGWLLQEWFLHSKLLHNDANWYGRRIHMRHHLVPFHHVSVDSPRVVLPVIVVSTCFWHLVFKGCPGLALTATLSYYTMGLIYEWTHYLVHTRVPMRSWLGRTIKRAHVRHHLRDERFWFSFTCPPIDDLLGTVPPQSAFKSIEKKA